MLLVFDVNVAYLMKLITTFLSYIFSPPSSAGRFPRHSADKPFYQGVWSTWSGYTAAAGSLLKTKSVVV